MPLKTRMWFPVLFPIFTLYIENMLNCTQHFLFLSLQKFDTSVDCHCAGLRWHEEKHRCLDKVGRYLNVRKFLATIWMKNKMQNADSKMEISLTVVEFSVERFQHVHSRKLSNIIGCNLKVMHFPVNILTWIEAQRYFVFNVCYSMVYMRSMECAYRKSQSEAS